MSTALRLNDEFPLPSLPLTYHWDEAASALPRRSIRATGRPRAAGLHIEAPPSWATGPAEQPFDFSLHVRRLCASIVKRCDSLRHVEVSQLLFGVTQARSGRPHGLQARVTPLRFRHGQLLRKRRGVTYQVQRYFVGGREMLYLVTFCLPRFLELDFDDKFVTLFHELYHINPAFDGDLRRHAGRYDLHSHSQREYDGQMADLARAYLATHPDPDLHAFLRLNFAQLQHRHRHVVGVAVPRPKLVPMAVRT